MAERFVYGFVVADDALQALVGSGLDPDEVLHGVSDEYVEMFNDEFGGRLSLIDCADDVLSGQLEDGQAYPYARVVEPILSVVGEPLGMIHMALTYYLENDSFGRWNPVLEEIGLSRTSALWAAANCSFPWPKGSKPRCDWPCVTMLRPEDLATVSGELASGWRGRLRLDEDTRDELSAGLVQLRGWVREASSPWASSRRCVAATGNSLVLVMGGGQ